MQMTLKFSHLDKQRKQELNFYKKQYRGPKKHVKDLINL